MIKTIIACADIHIRNYDRRDEYVAQLTKFIDECKSITEKHDSPEEVRIVIAGDIVNNKLDISGEGYIIASWFIKELDNIAQTYVIAGNHDMSIKNVNKIDPITAIFSICDFKRTYYIDKELDYKSGCINDDNITWCLYSIFDKYAAPNINEMKITNTSSTYVGLFHGEIKNAKTDVGFVFENGVPENYFDGLDFAILGHVHKRQCIKNNGTPLVYCGSLIQQNHGENISGHGYVVWNVEEQTYEEKNIPNEEYGFYTFEINSIEDIDNNIEDIKNL